MSTNCDGSQPVFMEHGYISVDALLQVARKTSSCFSCEHVDVEGNVCKLYGSQPPLKIIRSGCPSYVPDIPF